MGESKRCFLVLNLLIGHGLSKLAGSVFQEVTHMIKKRTIAVIILFSFSFSFIALAPVNKLWALMSSKIQLPMQVANLDGTLWNGSGLAMYQGQRINLSWNTQPFKLLIGQLSANIDANLKDAKISTTASVSALGTIRLNNLNGYVDEGMINPYLGRFQTSLQGRLQLNDIALQIAQTYDDSDQTENAKVINLIENMSGQFTWSGGTTKLPATVSRNAVEIPTLSATISAFENVRTINGDQVEQTNWLIDINDQNNNNMIDATLTPKGSMDIQVTRHWGPILGMEFQNNNEIISQFPYSVF